MRAEIEKLAYWLLKDVNKAISDYEMILDGDRVAVAVSGGKDSLTMLRLLDWRRSSIPEKYDIIAVHISGDAEGPICPAHPPLIDWLESSGYTYIVEELNIADSEPVPMTCQRCTWNKRKQLFEIAQRMECNVVSLGHNADDLAQTTLMNLLFHGRLGTMMPVSEYFSGVFKLIRPLSYISEADISQFARKAGFPAFPPECVRSAVSQRIAVKEFIQETQKKFPSVRQNLLRAGLRNSPENEKIS